MENFAIILLQVVVRGSFQDKIYVIPLGSYKYFFTFIGEHLIHQWFNHDSY